MKKLIILLFPLTGNAQDVDTFISKVANDPDIIESVIKSIEKENAVPIKIGSITVDTETHKGQKGHLPNS